MAKKVRLARLRVREGFWNDVIEGAWERYKEGGRESVQDAISDELVDRALGRYSEKIRAMFARGGVEIDPEQPITAQFLAQLISERTGLELNDLSPETVAAAVDKELSARLSEALRVPVSTVFDKAQLMEDLRAAIRLAIADGRGAELLTKGMVKAARAYATWKRHGAEGMERKRIENQAYQRKYRLYHRQVWY